MTGKALSPEIIRLMDKIANNPASRLFVPLAEEYLKSDMPDEAILVLVDGIKNHPTYVAARVMLGKIYLQKKQIAEAKNEFEHVIEVNPENILASKKLAVIYQGEGEVQKALDTCKKILMIDPSDKETKILLSSLEKEKVSFPSPAPIESPTEHLASAEADLPSPDKGGSDDLQEKAPLSNFSAEEQNPLEEAPSLVLPSLEQDVLISPPLPGEKTKEREPRVVSPSPYEGLSEPVKEEEPSPQKGDEDQIKIFDGPLPEYLSAQEESKVDLTEKMEMQQPERAVSENSARPEVNESPSFEPVSSETSPLSEPKEEVATGTLAALYMDQGHFQEAAEVYKKILERDPSDQESLKGLENALQKLSGPASSKDTPSGPEKSRGGRASGKTQRLQSWLDSIRKDKER